MSSGAFNARSLVGQLACSELARGRRDAQGLDRGTRGGERGPVEADEDIPHCHCVDTKPGHASGALDKCRLSNSQQRR